MKHAFLRQAMRLHGFTLSMALVAVAVTGLVGVRDAKAQTKFTAGTVFLSATAWPHYVAADKGYLKARGLDIDLIATRSSAKAIQQLVAESIQVNSSGMPDNIRAINKGGPIKIIMAQVATPPYMVYAKPSIKSIADLKGKTVIVGGSKDVTRIYVEALFAPAGLKPGDYDYIYAGSTSNRFAALMSGGVDAAIMLPPFSLRAEEQGYTNLGNIQSVLSDFPFTVYAVNANWAKKNRKVVIDYLAALLKGIKWLYNPANKEEAVSILTKWTKFKTDDGRKTYDIFMKEINAFRKDGAVTQHAYDQLINVLMDWGDIKRPKPPISKYIDDSYLKAALKQQ